MRKNGYVSPASRAQSHGRGPAARTAIPRSRFQRPSTSSLVALFQHGSADARLTAAGSASSTTAMDALARPGLMTDFVGRIPIRQSARPGALSRSLAIAYRSPSHAPAPKIDQEVTGPSPVQRQPTSGEESRKPRRLSPAEIIDAIERWVSNHDGNGWAPPRIAPNDVAGVGVEAGRVASRIADIRRPHLTLDRAAEGREREAVIHYVRGFYSDYWWNDYRTFSLLRFERRAALRRALNEIYAPPSSRR
jgi:hypothetical protein